MPSLSKRRRPDDRCCDALQIVVEIVESETECIEEPVRNNLVSGRRSVRVAMRLGISPQSYRRQKRWSVPDSFIQLQAFLQYALGNPEGKYWVIQWFCGKKAVVRAWERHGMKGFGFDIEYGEIDFDFCGDVGYTNAVIHSRDLREGCVQHWDPVCSSWVWVVKAASGRDPYYNPLGYREVPWVASGNLMVTRMVDITTTTTTTSTGTTTTKFRPTVLIALKDLSRGCPYLLEQPGSSCMRKHPRFDHLEVAATDLLIESMKRTQTSTELLLDPKRPALTTIPTWMARYGAPHAKRTELTSSCWPLLQPLCRTLSADARHRLTGEMTTDEDLVVCADGILLKRVTGRPSVLRGTKVYPDGYGEAVFRSWSSWYGSRSAQDRTSCSEAASSESDYSEFGEEWPDAGLHPILEKMSSALPECSRVW